jgi:hypothetical protein
MMETGSPAPLVESIDELEDGIDGLHHLWCRSCHPDWQACPTGAPLGVPFTAWCGVRAVILARWQSDAEPPGACRRCADPAAVCPVCGLA